MTASGDHRSRTGAGASGARPELNISLEKVCFVIAKARELDVKVAPEELDDASDDDMMQRILEDYADDPTFEELQSFLRDQNDDELKELLALAWLGRGDFAVEEWHEWLGRVRDVRRYHTADYLLGTPLLADFLEEGLSQLGLSCEEFELAGCKDERCSVATEKADARVRPAPVRRARQVCAPTPAPGNV